MTQSPFRTRTLPFGFPNAGPAEPLGACDDAPARYCLRAAAPAEVLPWRPAAPSAARAHEA